MPPKFSFQPVQNNSQFAYCPIILYEIKLKLRLGWPANSTIGRILR
jgi:hypothetical protein